MKKNTKRGITIHDLAGELSISASTVSRALNDDPRISPQTRQLVRQKAMEMGYQPNVIASNLLNRKTNTIGLIVPRIDRHFFSSAISGIEDFAWEHGYNVIILQSHDNFEREVDCVQALLNKRVDGLITSISMQTTDNAHFKRFIKSNTPLLFFDRFSPGIECDIIVIDDFEAGFRITKHLIESGRKRIAHIAGPTLLNIYSNRRNGYREALKQFEIPGHPEYLVETNLTPEAGVKVFKQLMSLHEPPDAVFCGNDTTALSLLLYCKENKISVPGDVALVGFSDEPFSALVTPSISTVRQPGYQMGQQAALRIISRIEAQNSDFPFETKVMPTELIIRESSCTSAPTI